MLPVERMRRPAAELGPNWLDVVTGRARTDEEEVGGVQEDEDGERGAVSTHRLSGACQRRSAS